MGYYSRVTGAITIAPVLTWSEYRDIKVGEYDAVKLRTHEERRDGEGGVMFVRWADGIIPATDESIKAYDVEAETQRIVSSVWPGHSFSGYLEIQGEEGPDLWRLYVRAGRVTRVEPKVVWPAEVPAGG